MSVALETTPYSHVCLQSSEHEWLFLNLAFHARRLKLKLNLICWRTQILRITAGKKEKCKSLEFPFDCPLSTPTHHNPTNKDAIG